MIIPTSQYKGYELRAYAHQVFPPFDDPYAQGPRRFSSIVRIEAASPTGVDARRFSTLFAGAAPTNAGDAIDLAMQFGKDILDDKVQAKELPMMVS